MATQQSEFFEENESAETGEEDGEEEL